MKKCAKLTEDQVRDLREFAARRRQLRQEANTLSNNALAAKFGVNRDTIRQAINGYTWKGVR